MKKIPWLIAISSLLLSYLPPAQAAIPSQLGVFRPQTGQWYFDYSGNRAWNRCGPDGCMQPFGAPGDLPIAGDWTGSGVSKVGVFRPEDGRWYLDLNGNSFWDGCGTDGCFGPFGAPVDRPVIGDWDGTGTLRFGVFRPTTGQWHFDLNGNGSWDGCGTDGCSGPFGASEDWPVAGDMDGDNIAEFGVYRPSTGMWYFDLDHSGSWSGCGADGCLGPFGAPEDRPVMTDINGDGPLEFGVFRPTTGQWYFDLDHNGTWSGCGVDGCFGGFGGVGDLPVVGPWDRNAGPGDPLNYFPLTQGSTWTFQGTYSDSDGSYLNYQNIATVSGTRIIDGVTTSVVSISNPGGEGPLQEYLLKDGRGITNWGNNDPYDTITPLVAAYQELIFPLKTGTEFKQFALSGVDLGEDLDGDRINERVNVSSQVTVAGYEFVSVPAGSSSNCAKVVNIISISGNLSSLPTLTFNVTTTTTTWYAPGAGPIKMESYMLGAASTGGRFSSYTSEVLTSYYVAVPSLSLPTNDIIFNPGAQKIFASVPSRAGANGNSVAVINPNTLQVESYLPVGSNPGKLALSDDSRYLYVALDGTGSVSRFDLLNTAAPVIDLQFSLGSDPFSRPYYVEDMEVLPGTPRSVAISRKYAGSSPRHAGVVIYDDDVSRAVTTPGHTGSNAIEFAADATTLYGYNNETTEFGFRQMTVDATGVAVDNVYYNLIDRFGADIEFDGGRIYSTQGQAINPEGGIVVGSYPSSTDGLLVEPDSASNRVFILTNDMYVERLSVIAVYNLSTFSQLGNIFINGVTGSPGSLIRWGTNGLAFRTTGDQLFIFRTSL